jgi:hypothetical protein
MRTNAKVVFLKLNGMFWKVAAAAAASAVQHLIVQSTQSKLMLCVTRQQPKVKRRWSYALQRCCTVLSFNDNKKRVYARSYVIISSFPWLGSSQPSSTIYAQCLDQLTADVLAEKFTEGIAVVAMELSRASSRELLLLLSLSSSNH